MKKTISALAAILILFTYVTCVYAEVPEIDAPSYILIDPATGQVLEQKAPDEIRYPASTTKIMTAVIAIETGKLDQKMAASEEAVSNIGVGGSNIGIQADEILTLKQLLKALLLSSANESANIIAENICSYSGNPGKEFVKLMNKRARELGAQNTHFTNPIGIHDPGHYTTVSDMAKIARYAMSLPVFREIAGSTGYSLPVTNKHESWDSLVITNKYLNPQYGGQYKPDSFTVTGVKTGFTTPAGNCLVTSAENKEGEKLLAVVFGVTNTDKSNNVYACTTRLLEWGFSSYSKQPAVSAGKLIKKVQFEGAKTGKTGLVTASPLKALLPVDKSKWQLDENIHWTGMFTAPAKKGSKLGFIEYSTNGVILGKVDLITDRVTELKLTLQIINFFKNIAKAVFSIRFFMSIAIIVMMFLILRMSLKFISRSIKANKQQG